MAAGPWQFPTAARTALIGATNLSSDTFSIGLFTSAWSPAAATTYSTTNELPTANGYTQGGISLGTLDLSGTGPVVVDDAASPAWTAAGGSLVARYAAVFNPAGNFLCYCELNDPSADSTITDTNSLTVEFNASGLFQVSFA